MYRFTKRLTYFLACKEIYQSNEQQTIPLANSPGLGAAIIVHVTRLSNEKSPDREVKCYSVNWRKPCTCQYRFLLINTSEGFFCNFECIRYNVYFWIRQKKWRECHCKICSQKCFSDRPDSRLKQCVVLEFQRFPMLFSRNWREPKWGWIKARCQLTKSLD